MNVRIKELLNQLLSQITEYSRQVFGGKLKFVILYGSYTCCDHNSESDIDVMIMVFYEYVCKFHCNKKLDTS